LLHLFLELYKRYHLFGKIDLNEILVAIKHCRLDFAFLFIGVAVEAICEHSFALALGRVAEREARLIELLRILPRMVGSAKVSKSVFHLAEEIFSKKEVKEVEKFSIDRVDVALILVVMTSLSLSSAFLFLKGYSLSEILHLYFHVLTKL
jgi:hypothetical protein